MMIHITAQIYSGIPLQGHPRNEDISFNQETVRLYREVYKTTPEMRTPPLIKKRVSAIEGFDCIISGG